MLVRVLVYALYDVFMCSLCAQMGLCALYIHRVFLFILYICRVTTRRAAGRLRPLTAFRAEAAVQGPEACRSFKTVSDKGFPHSAPAETCQTTQATVCYSSIFICCTIEEVSTITASIEIRVFLLPFIQL